MGIYTLVTKELLNGSKAHASPFTVVTLNLNTQPKKLKKFF
jgi:hypothetical protein